MTNRHLDADEWLILIFFCASLAVVSYLGIKRDEARRFESRQSEQSK